MKKILTLLIWCLLLSKVSNAQNSMPIDSLLLVLKSHTNEDTVKAKLLFTISRTLITNSEFAEAKKYAVEGLALSEKLKFDTGIIKLHSCLANVKRNEGMYEESLEHEFAALQILEKRELDSDRASVYNNIGVCYKNLGKFDEALKYHMLSLSIKNKLGDEQGIANSHNNIGLIYLNKNDYVKSFEHLFEALKWGEKTNNNKILSDCYNHIGLVYKHQENYTKALEYYSKSVDLQIETGNKNGAANAYNNIGVVLKQLGNYEEGIYNFNEALKIVEKTKNPKIEALTYNNLGNIYKRKGEVQFLNGDSVSGLADMMEAERYFLLSVKILRETKNWKGLAGALGNLGSLSHVRKKYSQSFDYFQEAIRLCEQYQFLDILRDISYNHSRLDSSLAMNSNLSEKKEQHWFNAYLNYRRYSRLQDSLVNEKVKQEISEIQTRYDTEKKDEQIKLLKAENEIQDLRILQNKTFLNASLIEKKQKENEFLLLQKSEKINALELLKVRQELERAEYKTHLAQSELTLLEKDRALNIQQLKNQKLTKNALLAGIFLLSLAGFLAFSRYKLSRQLEQQQAIESERKRISADLHDDIGSGLSKISFLSDLLVTQAKSPEAKAEASRIAAASKSLTENISEIVWSLNTSSIKLNDLIAFIRRYAVEFFENSSITLKTDMPAECPDYFISAVARRNIFFAVKEALNNIIKHSVASEALLKFSLDGKTLRIVIFDNGKGIQLSSERRSGNGLLNMEKRMAFINGNFHLENHVGTTVTLQIPLIDTPQG